VRGRKLPVLFEARFGRCSRGQSTASEAMFASVVLGLKILVLLLLPVFYGVGCRTG